MRTRIRKKPKHKHSAQVLSFTWFFEFDDTSKHMDMTSSSSSSVPFPTSTLVMSARGSAVTAATAPDTSDSARDRPTEICFRSGRTINLRRRRNLKWPFCFVSLNCKMSTNFLLFRSFESSYFFSTINLQYVQSQEDNSF